MGYSDNPEMVRVDFFKESGKWYTTEAIKWIGNGFSDNAGPIHDQFRDSLKQALGGRLDGMFAVCLEPYHKHQHPLMVKVGEPNHGA